MCHEKIIKRLKQPAQIVKLLIAFRGGFAYLAGNNKIEHKKNVDRVASLNERIWLPGQLIVRFKVDRKFSFHNYSCISVGRASSGIHLT